MSEKCELYFPNRFIKDKREDMVYAVSLMASGDWDLMKNI